MDLRILTVSHVLGSSLALADYSMRFSIREEEKESTHTLEHDRDGGKSVKNGLEENRKDKDINMVSS